MTATARRRARLCREQYAGHYGSELDIAVVGQIARGLVLLVDAMPRADGAATVGERREVLGGKGANQAVACAQLGVSVALLGVVGDDEVGTRLLAAARADHIDTACVVRRPGTPTALIVSVVAEDAGRRYFEDIGATTLTDTDITCAADTLVAAKSVIVQLQQPAALTAARLARAAGRRVVLDGVPAADQRADLLATATVLRADAHEAELITGSRLGTVESTLRAARELLNEGPSLVALAVEGEGDAFAWAEDELFLPYTGTPTDAGDSFIAALTVALTRGEPPAAAARAAADAAGSTAGRLGGRPALGPRS